MTVTYLLEAVDVGMGSRRFAVIGQEIGRLATSTGDATDQTDHWRGGVAGVKEVSDNIAGGAKETEGAMNALNDLARDLSLLVADRDL